jgi:hypothetical protein
MNEDELFQRFPIGARVLARDVHGTWISGRVTEHRPDRSMDMSGIAIALDNGTRMVYPLLLLERQASELRAKAFLFLIEELI